MTIHQYFRKRTDNTYVYTATINGEILTFLFGHSEKKSLFHVQRMAKIVVRRVAPKYLLSLLIFSNIFSKNHKKKFPLATKLLTWAHHRKQNFFLGRLYHCHN